MIKPMKVMPSSWAQWNGATWQRCCNETCSGAICECLKELLLFPSTLGITFRTLFRSKQLSSPFSFKFKAAPCSRHVYYQTHHAFFKSLPRILFRAASIRAFIVWTLQAKATQFKRMAKDIHQWPVSHIPDYQLPFFINCKVQVKHRSSNVNRQRKCRQ